MKILIPSILVTATLVLNGCGGGSSPVSGINNQPLVQNPVPTTTPTTPTTPTPTPVPVSGFTIPPIDEATKQDYLDAINVARGNIQHCGSYGDFTATTPLTWSDALYKASYEHSYDLANSNTFSHTGSNTQYDITAQQLSLNAGSSITQRIEYNGYTNWRRIGENILAGESTVEATIDGWLNSPGHCANLMNPDFTEVGLALLHKTDSTYKDYWTQNLGDKF